MDRVHLICPKCKKQEGYDKSELDISKELTCTACGFSELPTSFELAKDNETRGMSANRGTKNVESESFLTGQMVSPKLIFWRAYRDGRISVKLEAGK